MGPDPFATFGGMCPGDVADSIGNVIPEHGSDSQLRSSGFARERASGPRGGRRIRSAEVREDAAVTSERTKQRTKAPAQARIVAALG